MASTDIGILHFWVGTCIAAGGAAGMTAAVVGVLVVIANLALSPAPLAGRILLAAPLIVVPSLVRFAEAEVPRLGPAMRLAPWPVLVAALPLVVAYALEPGLVAALLTIPWLALAGVLAFAGALDGLSRLPTLSQRESLIKIAADVALGFLTVGALFLTSERLGFAPFGFSDPIVLVTAIHFHFAGFGLLMIGSTIAARLRSVPLTGAAMSLAVGMPVTAAAILVDAEILNAIGALLVVLGALGIGLGLLDLRPPPLAVAGLLLLVGVPFGLAWALAPLLETPSLGFVDMVRIHGGLNSTAVVLVALSIREVQS